MLAMTSSFLHRDVRAFGREVHRIGLSASFGLDEAGIEAAFERGIQYVFWNPTARALTRVLSRMPASRRERLVLATGPSLAYFPGSLRRRVERVLKLLGTDSIDVLKLYWLGRMSAFTEAIKEEAARLKESGKVRLVGASIHDRKRAGSLAAAGELDLFMIRYNAAHPGAEKDIFPHLSRHQPAVVAYTATSWRRLLKAPAGWSETVPSPADCYRFCLTNPNVDIVLMGAASQQQLDENLRGLEKGPLSVNELEFMRRFGSAVHG